MALLGGICGNNGNVNDSSISPLELSPVAWYRSDLGITLTSGSVTQWNDQSGNGWNLTVRPSFGIAPVYSTNGGPNGTPALLYPGSDETWLVNTAFNQVGVLGFPMENFIVCTPTVLPVGVNSFIFDLGSDQGTDTPGICELWQQNETSEISFGGAVSGLVDYIYTLNAPIIINTCCNNTGSSFMAVNGGAPQYAPIVNYPASSSPQVAINVGHYGQLGNYSFGGMIMEVIVFNYELFPNQRTQILQYLNARYGIL